MGMTRTVVIGATAAAAATGIADPNLLHAAQQLGVEKILAVGLLTLMLTELQGMRRSIERMMERPCPKGRDPQ